MIYNRSSTKEKWTIMMYMRDFNLMTTYAYALRASNQLTNENINEILSHMEKEGIYRPRNGGSTFTGQFKSIQIAWYMFGYYNKSKKNGQRKKMVFSPLGNLLLDNLKDKGKCAKIFLAMLFGNGFRQPFSKMSEEFNIFAFRLIFKLLRDPRLNGRLYNDEVFYYVMFIKDIDIEKYDVLVADILNFRKMSPYKKMALFKKDEHVVGLACHEWRYAVGMLESAKLITINNDNGNRIIGSFTYGGINKKTGRRNAVRNYREDYIVLREELIPLADTLLRTYPYYDRPYPEDETSSKFSSSVVVDMYSFYPSELLKEIGIHTREDKVIAEMLHKASDLNFYSHEETAGGENFECAICDAFNMFVDVDAERIAGAGNTDIECLYYREIDGPTKFDIEAKARKNKLVEINPSRLHRHRKMIGSKYTMIVAPNYTIGVIRDIEEDESVIVRSATLANYIYQSVLKNGRNISYKVLDEIILSNKGKDITDIINEYVYSNFGHVASDISISAKR